MENKVIITCAITGGMTVPAQSDAIPITPQQIVDSAVKAHEAGAAIVHLHVRDPETGHPSPDPDLFEEVMTGVARRCDVVVQPTTGGGVGQSLEERARVVSRFRPEMATFNTGSFNFGLFPIAQRDLDFEQWERDYLEGTRDYIFKNTFADMEFVCSAMREAQTKPELETYDVGHLYNVKYLVDQGLLDTPVHLQFVLGVLGANAAEVEQLMHMRRTATSLFGSDYTWCAAGVGYPGEFHLAATCLMLGGHVRVGLEDNLRVARGKRASSNAELVEKAVALAELLDRSPATPDDARKLLGLKGRAATGF